MSNVLKRQRSISELEFYKIAVQVQIEMTQFVMNEKNIPKRWKFVHAMPTIAILRNMMNNIVAANTIYPTNEQELLLRKEYQTKAIINCEQLIQSMHYMIATRDISADKMKRHIDDVMKEIRLLKAWRKTSKVMTS